ncbi:MAG TPA: flippase [Candidatus Acidoferrum sp.]|nr:flippase [Candidatus Acidoferrum sp.]
MNASATVRKLLPHSHNGEPRISGAVLLTAAQIVRSVSRFFFVLVAARKLGPESFGIYTLILALTEIIAVISGNGFGDYLTREIARDARVGWGVGAQLTWLRIAYSVPLAAAGLSILWLLGYSRTVLFATAGMSLTLAPRSVTESVQGLLRGIGRNRGYLAVDLISGLVLSGGAGLTLAIGGRLNLVIAAEVLASVVAGVVALVLAARNRTPVRIQCGWSALVKRSAVFNIYPFVINLYDRIDILLLSKLAGDYATGVYGAAYRPLNVLQLLPYGILYSLLPALARGDNSETELNRLGKAMGLLLCAALLIVLGTTVFADALVPLLFGSRFAAAAPALKILVWAVILRYLNYALNTRLLVTGNERLLVATSLVCLAVNVVGNLLLIPIFLWRAAAVLTIVTELVLLVQNVYWLRRITGAVPTPFGWARTSLVFAVLLGVALAGARVLPPLLIGAACLLFFLGYLYRAGMIGECAAAWDAVGSAAVEVSNS